MTRRRALDYDELARANPRQQQKAIAGQRSFGEENESVVEWPCLLKNRTKQKGDWRRELSWLKTEHGIERDCKPPRGDAGEDTNKTWPPYSCEIARRAAYEMRHCSVSGECRILCPPVQVPRVEDAVGRIDCESRTTQDSAQYDLEGLVVEIAEDNVI